MKKKNASNEKRNEKIKKTKSKKLLQKQGFYNRKMLIFEILITFQNTIVGGNQITRKTIV